VRAVAVQDCDSQADAVPGKQKPEKPRVRRALPPAGRFPSRPVSESAGSRPACPEPGLRASRSARGADIWNPYEVYSLYIPRIYHVYTWTVVYIYGIYHVYTKDIKILF
jgi:hypothetical protein